MSEKFSTFIQAPGSAGPPTRNGISALGFVLSSEVPGFLGSYVRVDVAQSFTNGEKTQGRGNIDAQQFSASLTSLAGLTTAADRLAYTTAADTWAVTALTAFARTILDDTNAAGVRTTIGLGNVDNTSDANKPISTATQTALDLKANLASPAFTGNPTAPTPSPGDNDTTLATTAFVTAAVGAAAVFTKQYVSSGQTITSAGALSLSHGLSAVPKVITIELVCLTAENGYSIGDVVEWFPLNSSSTANVVWGVSVVKNSSTIEIRYTGQNPVFTGIHKTTGAQVNFTNANWNMVVRAYA